MSINSGAVLQFSLLAHTVPVSVELDRDEVEMKVNEQKTKTKHGRSTYNFFHRCRYIQDSKTMALAEGDAQQEQHTPPPASYHPALKA